MSHINGVQNIFKPINVFVDVLVDPLQHFITSSILPTKKLGRDCDHAMESYETALSKYASRSKRDSHLADVSAFTLITINIIAWKRCCQR